MKTDPKVERVIRWRESLSTMKDERFFDIIRTYLGEVHTPYNKDKLIESLSAIFRKEENKKIVLSFLSDFDIKILSAISFLENPTQTALANFFEGEFSFSEMYSELLTLCERMVIYSYKDKNHPDKEALFSINPLLEDFLSPYINISSLFPTPENVVSAGAEGFVLTPQFIASIISYIRMYPDLCKNDLSIRKKDVERLEVIFPKKTECVQAVLNAFVNLEIVRVGQKGVFFDESKLEKFACLEECKQYAYLASASPVRLGRIGLKIHAQLFLDIASAIPQEGFSKSSLIRTAFLFSNKSREDDADSYWQGNFSRMLNSYTGYDKKNLSPSGIIDSIIESAITLGLFIPIGKRKDGSEIYKAATCILQNEGNEGEEKTPHRKSKSVSPKEKAAEESGQKIKKGLININAGTNISVLPGLTLHELIPFTLFMNIASCNTVCEFEITRQSASRAFDMSVTPNEIFETLSAYSAYEIPQSLKMNIEDWYNSYSSAMLFKGYILKVDEKNARIIENNARISSYIQMTLAPGIYLLNIPMENDVDRFIRTSGLEFLGNVKTPKTASEAMDFPILRSGKNFFDKAKNDEIAENILSLAKSALETKKRFHEKLETLSLNAQQKECLSARIDRGIIIVEEQLRADAVKIEILEVEGMNYPGKIRLLENAISAGCLVEIFESSDKNPMKLKSVIGKPLSLSRHTNDCFVKMQLEQTQETQFFSVSHANRIKMIKSPLFMGEH